jgi:hypothetical protein
MAYIYPAPGVAGVQATLKVHKTSKAADATGLAIPALQDVTVNAANDVFTWTQLDNTAKLQIATTSTNSLSMNIVLDQTTFFGTTGSGGSTAAAAGIFGLSVDKAKVFFDLYLGDTDAGGTGKIISGSGYITGLAPTVSADSPVWVSPITITVTGEYTVTAGS